MANDKYSRPASGMRFLPGGINTTSPADGLKENEYPYLQNLRWTLENAPQARPQLVQSIAAPSSGGGPVLNIEPSLGLYKIGTGVFYNGASVDGGYSTDSAAMTPFRPSESPSAWEYIWDSAQQHKILPSGPTAQKIGIAEPQVPAEAGCESPYSFLQNGASGFTLGGTASSLSSGTRVTDTVLAAVVDPGWNGGAGLPFPGTHASTSVAVSANFHKDETVFIGSNLVRIIDVIPPLQGTLPIQSIYYFSGTTGRCVIGLNIGLNATYEDAVISSIRRGALISVGSETYLYVLSSVQGPTGVLAIEVVTASTHTTSDTISVASVIVVDNVGAAAGQTITATVPTFTIGSGIGTVTGTFGYNPFNTSGPFTDNDYFHVSAIINGLPNLNELKILIDVSDGTFTKDYYFYAIRPSDIAAGVQNSLTQLGVAQISTQRDTIDEESKAKGITASSGQTDPADNVWSEISFPISEFTRVGSDQTKSLNTCSGKFQYLFNTSGVAYCQVAYPSVFGGYQPDINIALNPYKFKYRGRSSVTGAKSNCSPEMRYGLRPRRAAMVVTLPSTAYDSQVDTWDIFIMGGGLDAYRYAGSIPVGSANVFGYNMTEAQVASAEILEDDNYEPFPTITKPFNATANYIGGTVITAFSAGGFDTSVINRMLPGNIITIGQNDYTLRQRPTEVASGAIMFQTVEAISAGSVMALSIAEPEIANQPLPNVWGPDNNGIMFGCGDSYRPDFIYTTKANNPDSCPDRNKEISVPTDPLINGCLLDQTSFVASPSRWWRGYPQDSSEYIDYNWAEIPVGEGLAASRGICSDGKLLYFVGHTGINATSGGPKKSLTDEKLRNLFPHEDTPGQNVTYAGNTLYAPAYQYASTFRLSTCNGYLYFDYQDSTQTPRSLVLDLIRGGWVTDVCSPAITTRGVVTLPDSPSSGTVISRLYMGDTTGAINTESHSLLPFGEQIDCVLCTRAETAGDLRASKQWGDAAFTALSGVNIAMQAILDGVVSGSFTDTSVSSSQVTNVVSLDGGALAQALGLMLTWTDRGTVTIPFSWQPSYISKPETVTDRSSDWMNAGSAGNKFWQGFRITVDTFGTAKQFTVYDERGTSQQTFTITTSGEVTKAYSFATPFYSHMVMVKMDSVPCREFGIEWVTQPAPETVLNWSNQPTAYGQLGYQHVRQMMVAHMSTADLTLQVTVDNVPLTPLTIPNSGGAYKKTLVMLPPNKGLVYDYQINSTTPFQLWDQDFEIWLKAWDSSGPYINAKLLGSDLGDKAEI